MSGLSAEQRERLAEAWREGETVHRRQMRAPHLMSETVLDFMTPVIAGMLDQAAADAWDEGRRTGASRAMRRMSDEPSLPLASEADNPYLASSVTASDQGEDHDEDCPRTADEALRLGW